ncbi:MATE family efflux transporter [Coprothermobacter platensis]|uniref:MATE family efflux transporter n=1 Tax=Coprothermobacter platensis TaxID=108819 RepID=UPI0003A003BB|nr:MATE family efflux transporter [Coprothermobacter platensis]
MNAQEQMTQGEPKRVLWSMALPNMIGSLFSNALPAIELALIAALGTNAIAAAGIVNMLVSLIFIYNEAWGTGSVIVMANYIGRKDYEKAKLALKETTYGKFFGALVLVLLCFPFLETLLSLLGARSDILPIAYSYALPFLLGVPFAMAGYSTYTFFRATGQTVWAMWFMLLQTAANMLLDIFLIKGLWIFPAFGLAGAGWAYLISWIIGDIGAFIFIASPAYELPTNILQGIKFTQVGIEVFKVGFYAGLSNLSSVVVSVLTQRIINAVSIPVFAALQVFNRIVQIPNTVLSSIALISTPIMAQNVGANLHDRVRTFVHYCIRIGMWMLGIFAIICLAAPSPILALFQVKDPTLMPLSVAALRIMAAVPLLTYGTSIFISYFQAYNNTKLPFILNSICQWLFYAPMLYLLLVVLKMTPTTAFWLTTLNSLLALVLHWYYWNAHKKLVDNHFFD